MVAVIGAVGDSLTEESTSESEFSRFIMVHSGGGFLHSTNMDWVLGTY